MRGVNRETAVPYVTLAVLVISLVLLNYSGTFVRTHMDSGANWFHWGYQDDQVALNSTVSQVNRTITSVRLHITHFNVSTANASVVVLSQDGVVLLNQTEASGSWIPGVATTLVGNSSSSPLETYVLCFYWTGTNTTVSYEYEVYALLFWDGVPYTILLPGFHETNAAGMSLFIGTMMMFTITLWMQTRSANRVALHGKYALLILAYLVPSLLRLRVYDSIVSYSIFSSIWSYTLYANPWTVSQVTLVVNAQAEMTVVLCSVVNTILFLFVLTMNHRVASYRLAAMAVSVSFVPYVIVLLTDLWSATTPYTPDVYYLPLPLLQFAALCVMKSLTIPPVSQPRIQ